MVDELHSLCVEGEGRALAVVLEEELDGGGIELEGDGLQEVDEVAQHFIVLKVKAHGHNLIDHVVGEQVEDGCGGADVLDEDGQRLQHLLGHIPPPVPLLLQKLGKMVDEIVLCEVVEVARIVLITPAAAVPCSRDSTMHCCRNVQLAAQGAH